MTYFSYVQSANITPSVVENDIFLTLQVEEGHLYINKINQTENIEDNLPSTIENS